jgi:RNA polymerase sigma-70 factor
MDPHTADLALARACGNGEAEALRQFEQRFTPVAQRALGRLGGGRAFVADALQELRVRLFTGPRPRILEYAGTGPLEAWVKITAVRVALNLRERDDKHQPRALPESDDARAVGALHDPELELAKLRYRDEVHAALNAAFAALDPGERSLLKLYLVDRLNIGEIGKIIGKSRATVGRLVVSVRERLLEDTRARLAGTLGIPQAEVDSVLRLVRSGLDLTLSRILR